MNTRAKGNAFERKIADLFTAAGFGVRGLEGQGDHLIVCKGGLVISSECKRRERVALPTWWRQTVADAPAGTVPLLTFQQNRGETLSVIRTADLIALLAQLPAGAQGGAT